MCDIYLYSDHKFIDGISKLKQKSNALSHCSTYIEAKTTTTNFGPKSPKRAIHKCHGSSIDFCVCVKSKNTGQREDFLGINGETY